MLALQRPISLSRGPEDDYAAWQLERIERCQPRAHSGEIHDTTNAIPLHSGPCRLPFAFFAANRLRRRWVFHSADYEDDPHHRLGDSGGGSGGNRSERDAIGCHGQRAGRLRLHARRGHGAYDCGEQHSFRRVHAHGYNRLQLGLGLRHDYRDRGHKDDAHHHLGDSGGGSGRHRFERDATGCHGQCAGRLRLHARRGHGPLYSWEQHSFRRIHTHGYNRLQLRLGLCHDYGDRGHKERAPHHLEYARRSLRGIRSERDATRCLGQRGRQLRLHASGRYGDVGWRNDHPHGHLYAHRYHRLPDCHQDRSADGELVGLGRVLVEQRQDRGWRLRARTLLPPHAKRADVRAHGHWRRLPLGAERQPVGAVDGLDNGRQLVADRR